MMPDTFCPATNPVTVDEFSGCSSSCWTPGISIAAKAWRTGARPAAALVPQKDELAIVLRGDLAAILRFAAGKRNPDFLSEAGAIDGLLSQVSVVAGARFELATFRL